jgi:hypothetical protein
VSSPPPNTELVQRKKHRQMDRLRRTLSFRSRKKNNAAANNNNNNHQTSNTATTTTTAGTSSIKNGNGTPAITTTTTTADNKPSQWQDDEKSVRVGACSFNVKVLTTIFFLIYIYI